MVSFNFGYMDSSCSIRDKKSQTKRTFTPLDVVWDISNIRLVGIFNIMFGSKNEKMCKLW